MKIIKGNIWSCHSKGYIVIPTNGVVKNNGENVMGAGLALQAKNKYPCLPILLGSELKERGNIPILFKHYKIITFPTKNHYKDKSDINLIERSCYYLSNLIIPQEEIYMPKIGCGCGQLIWKEVKSIIDKHLPEINIVDFN